MEVNSTTWIWRTVGSVSAAATLLLLFGFISAINTIVNPSSGGAALAPDQKTAPSANPVGGADEASEIRVAAIGDSLAKGTGDDTGNGFVRRTVQILNEQEGRSARLINNLGINGLTTEGLLTKLDEPGTSYVLKEANLIMLSIGGNDLFAGVQATEGTGVPPTAEQLRAVLPAAQERVAQVLEKLHTINPNAKVVYLGLYNPFGDLKEYQVPGNAVVAEWNQSILALMSKHQNMVLIPSFDLFQQNLQSYLSSDHFHPNGDGYQAIAERVAQGYGPAPLSKKEEAQP
nr:GDSL-type esterase/lipase family protein [Paenibacillus massiliensis]